MKPKVFIYDYKDRKAYYFLEKEFDLTIDDKLPQRIADFDAFVVHSGVDANDEKRMLEKLKENKTLFIYQTFYEMLNKNMREYFNKRKIKAYQAKSNPDLYIILRKKLLKHEVEK